MDGRALSVSHAQSPIGIDVPYRFLLFTLCVYGDFFLSLTVRPPCLTVLEAWAQGHLYPSSHRSAKQGRASGGLGQTFTLLSSGLMAFSLGPGHAYLCPREALTLL